jgi:hypothetical protein
MELLSKKLTFIIQADFEENCSVHGAKIASL